MPPARAARGDQSADALVADDDDAARQSALRVPATSAGKRGLAVAGDAGKAGDLAAAQRERHAVERRAVALRGGRDVFEGEQRRAGRRRGSTGGRRDFLRRPSARRVRRGRWRRSRARRPAVPARSTRTRSLTAITSSSLCEMKMIDRPCATSELQRAKQRVGLGRRQHRRRLVEDEDARVAIERLEDFDALALADRRGRRRVASGSTARPKSARELARCARARRRRSSARLHERLCVPSAMFSSTVMFSASVKCWCTMPMPASSAARGSPGGSGLPKTSTVPSSAT